MSCRVLLPMVITLLGCTSIPEPAERGEADAGPEEPPDAGPSGGPYAGPCVQYGQGTSRGVIPMVVSPAPQGDGRVAYTVFRFAVPEDDEIRRIELYAAGIPAELRGRKQDLGVGANAHLSTCVHCMLVYRQCDTTGLVCASGPYFPRSGQAMTPQVAEASGAANAFLVSDAELVRVSIGDDLSVTPLSGDEDCIHFDSLIVSDIVGSFDGNCEPGVQCALTANASDRHPD